MALQVGIDWGTSHYHVGAGQFRFAMDLLRKLHACDLPFNVTVFGSRATPPEELEPMFCRLPGSWRWLHHHRPGGFKGSHFVGELCDAVLYRRHRLNLLHSIDGLIPMWAPCPIVWTCHDLMMEVFDQQNVKGNRGYRRHRLAATTRVTRYLASSQTTARDLTRFWGVPAESIDVVYLSASGFPPPSWSEEELTRTQAESSPGFRRIVVSSPYNLEPRKNLGTLLEATALLVSRGVDVELALFGKAAWTEEREREFEARTARLGITERIQRLGRIDDLTLARLYRLSTAFVYPTLYEGFGLPLLEAMTMGACALAHNASAMAEVGAGGALLIDMSNAGEIAAALEQIIADPQHAAAVRKSGIARAAAFSSEKMAREVLAAYAKVLGQ